MGMWKFDKILFSRAHFRRDDSGGSMALESRVKQEPHDQVSDHALIKRETEFTDEQKLVNKELLSLGNECNISEAAMLAGLYKDHTVKDELVVGPEHPHRPDVMLVVHGWASADADGCPNPPALERPRGPELALRDCYVRLERLQHHEAPAGHDAAAPNSVHTSKFYTEDEIYTKKKKGKEVIIPCDRLALKSDLKKHVKIHIQKLRSMTMEKDKHCAAGRDKNKSSGGRKQRSARERAASKLHTQCFVRIERLPHHALLRCNMRPATALRQSPPDWSETSMAMKKKSNVTLL
ncbi:uncharacterized protein LOC133532229 isoform X3 [Cydia pomonella]|uniref:uncharacterized protein LOC133532229 isoform X3 n=1 Tax=Cydia pomonella TaxID=82600 RepID=UPI002ADE69AA|nr:uncharacterized protein LOC133532229 isoform X3 [Cydia pomonella]